MSDYDKTPTQTSPPWTPRQVRTLTSYQSAVLNRPLVKSQHFLRQLDAAGNPISDSNHRALFAPDADLAPDDVSGLPKGAELFEVRHGFGSVVNFTSTCGCSSPDATYFSTVAE